MKSVFIRTRSGILLYSAVIFFVLFTIPVYSQESSSFAVSVTPESFFGVGGKAVNYRPGLGCRLDAIVGLPALELFSPAVEVGYSFIPLDLGQSGYSAETNLGIVNGGIAVLGGYPLTDRISITARAFGGAYYGFLQGGSSGTAYGPSFGGGLGLNMTMTPRLLINLGCAYESSWGLFDAVSVSIQLSSRLRGPGGASIPREDFSVPGAGTLPADGYIRFLKIELDRVFPVLYKYYDEHPIGSAVVRNEGKRRIEDIEIRFSLNQYMDTPKVSARIDSLDTGEEKVIDLYALFTEDILEVTEGAKLAATLSAAYSVNERPGADDEVVTLDTFERNALRWDDDRKIAAFVTARDDEVQRFARNVASITEDTKVEAVSRELQLAIALFTALNEHEVAYVIDPSSAYADMSQSSSSVDSVQFPRQTLQFCAGDCDDLSATYNALLEAVGVETAFITVPGHIFTAFKLKMKSSDAREIFFTRRQSDYKRR